MKRSASEVVTMNSRLSKHASDQISSDTNTEIENISGDEKLKNATIHQTEK